MATLRLLTELATAGLPQSLWVTGLVKGTLLIALAALLCAAFGRSSAAVRHAIWSLALSSLLLLPVLSGLVPVWHLSLAPDEDDLPADRWSDAFAVPAAAAASPQAAATSPIGPTATAAHLVPSLTTLWLVGALAVLARLLFGLARLGWISRRAIPVPAAFQALARELTEQVGVSRPIRILESGATKMPQTWGVLRPVILLPRGFESWSDERLRVVLSHELVHVRRADSLVQICTQLCCALYWFNPLVWTASRRLRLERERACDDQVLVLGARPTEYAGHLLEIARSLIGAPAASFAAVTMARRSQLEGRLLAILDVRRSRRKLTRATSALAIGLTLVVAAPIAAISPEGSGDEVETTKPSPGETALLAELKSSDWQVREKAAQKLATQGSAAAVEPLIRALGDPVWQVRKYAAFALTQLGDRRAVDPLISALSDSRWDVREQSAIALGQIGDPRATEALKKVLNDPDWHVREQANLAVTRLTHASGHDDSGLAALHDPDWRVRQQVILSHALERPLSEASLAVLFAGLTDADWHVREVTAAVLARSGEPRAVDPLLRALGDPDFHVRGAAAAALGLLGDARAVPAIEKLLRDSSADVREDAQRALERLKRPV